MRSNLWHIVSLRRFRVGGRARTDPFRRFPAPRAAACLVHCLLLQKVTSPRLTILNGFRLRRAVSDEFEKFGEISVVEGLLAGLLTHT